MVKVERSPEAPQLLGSAGRLWPPFDRRRLALLLTGVIFLAGFAWGVPQTRLSLGSFISGADSMWALLQRMLPPRFEDLEFNWWLLLGAGALALAGSMARRRSRVAALALLGAAAALAILSFQFSEAEGGVSRVAFTDVLGKTVETFFVAVAGTVLAVVLSVPTALLAARNTTPGPLFYYPARAFIVVNRTIPDLVFALIFVRALGLGTLPGVLALGLHSIGMLGKLFADAIEEIDEGPRDAVLSTGASRSQAILSAVAPQILPTIIGMSLYRLDINVRLSAVLGFVGAGGIGLLLRATLGNLRYDEALAIILVVVVMIIVVEFFSAAVRRSLVGGDTQGIPRRSSLTGTVVRMFSIGRAARNGDHAAGAPAAGELSFDRERVVARWTPERRRRATYWGLIAAMILGSVWVADTNPLQILAALPKIWEVTTRFFPPDFSGSGGEWLDGDLMRSMGETIAIGVVSTVFGILLAIPVGFLAARNIAPARWVYVAARYFLVLERAVPELVVAVIFVAAVGLGPFPGVLALVYGTIGFAAKLFADALEEVKPGPREAVQSTGASPNQERLAAVVPQVMPSFVGTSLYLLDINIRSATVLGIVGAGGVGFYLVQSIRTLEFARTSAILLMVFFVVYLIEIVAGWVRKLLI